MSDKKSGNQKFEELHVYALMFFFVAIVVGFTQSIAEKNDPFKILTYGRITEKTSEETGAGRDCHNRYSDDRLERTVSV